MLRKIYNRVSPLFGANFFCPVCEKKIRQFLPLPNSYKENFEKYGHIYHFNENETLNNETYSCPFCSASDRDRLYALYVSRYIKELSASNINMLEIAPSPSLTRFLKHTGKVFVRTADLMMQGVDDHVDITNMTCYSDRSFDCFICSHVLEHVQDDSKAIQELYRILKPNGWGILMVPIVLTITEIDEDPSVKDIGERWRRFGQNDHVRLYSKNGFIERVCAAGFTIKLYGQEYFGENVFNLHGISSKSVLYVVEKK